MVNMKKIVSISMASIVCLVILGLAVTRVCDISQYLDKCAVNKVEARYGCMPLSPEQEAKVVAIALEMGITEKIIIRKMNSFALQTYGYHNAFVTFGRLFEVLPLSTQPFLYISAGFFEDLSDAEQRFLIGHELIHARDRHLLFYDLFYKLTIILLVVTFWLVNYYFSRRSPQLFFKKIFIMVLFYIGLIVIFLTGMFYRRYIERVADCESLKLLNSYDGFFQLNQRWQRDFCMPKHNNYFGLLADHPSCHEREQYCLALQQKSAKSLA